MAQTLLLHVDRQPGSLQRILVNLTRRGFEPQRIEARRSGAHFRVEVDVEGDHPASVLVRHLDGLQDVRRAELVAAGTRKHVGFEREYGSSLAASTTSSPRRRRRFGRR